MGGVGSIEALGGLVSFSVDQEHTLLELYFKIYIYSIYKNEPQTFVDILYMIHPAVHCNGIE